MYHSGWKTEASLRRTNFQPELNSFAHSKVQLVNHSHPSGETHLGSRQDSAHQASESSTSRSWLEGKSWCLLLHLEEKIVSAVEYGVGCLRYDGETGEFHHVQIPKWTQKEMWCSRTEARWCSSTDTRASVGLALATENENASVYLAVWGSNHPKLEEIDSDGV